jgi:hypothetical protein
VIAAARVSCYAAAGPLQTRLQFHKPLFLRQLFFERASDALAPLAEVATAALQLLQLCLQLILLRQELVQFAFDLSFGDLNL